MNKVEIKSELLYTIRINEEVISLTMTQINDLVRLFKLSESLLNINNYKISTSPMNFSICDSGYTLTYIVEIKDNKPIYRIWFLQRGRAIVSLNSVDYFTKIIEELQRNEYA